MQISYIHIDGYLMLLAAFDMVTLENPPYATAVVRVPWSRKPLQVFETQMQLQDADAAHAIWHSTKRA
jgi:hypothetical protein